MGSIFEEFKDGQKLGSGHHLAAALTPVSTAANPGRLQSFYYFSNAARLSSDLRYSLFQANGIRLPKQEQNSWVDIFAAYWSAAGELVRFEEASSRASWVKVFNAWKETANQLIRGYSTGGLQAWTIPCLYVVGRYLRQFARKADAELASQESDGFGDGFQDDVATGLEKNAKLEEATRVLNRMFTLCLTDRSPIEESRKWGVYDTTNLLFKTYFKLNTVGLSKNLLRALNAQSADLPELDAFPKSHIVTFKYYVGVIHFLDENYAEAEQHLAEAWRMCHCSAMKNRELILTYLIPCHLVTTHTLPSKKLLAPFPRLEKLYRPLCNCIKKGDLGGFDAAMSAGEEEFVKRRIYLPLERGRDIALRNLFRKVFTAGGFEESKDGQPPIRRTRVPVAEFAAAVRIGTHADERSRVDIDEVECLLSNLIYKGLMKGYIARERGMVVLSKGGSAFPGTGV
ncbi:protein csn12 [Aspergillus brunneoviolaceus CBS 621.78]|uniref:COP9 signalosome complex subunit n=1 Tax=Aspergillus brunneoviolaceus CBS 621.78 TaxID=1450534 RepID=A0ACD1G921_9EURO|nr:COP9 signalosome complex subunit [Aspergillus brunneoviolaceus CBS 621.78]RAH45744.1 COP9 signalosome complex subunit [Aspergillus brunneoviolaceus CBS 621.78]